MDLDVQAHCAFLSFEPYVGNNAKAMFSSACNSQNHTQVSKGWRFQELSFSMGQAKVPGLQYVAARRVVNIDESKVSCYVLTA